MNEELRKLRIRRLQVAHRLAVIDRIMLREHCNDGAPCPLQRMLLNTARIERRARKSKLN